MDETDAVEALDNLGLSTYEAKVFIALQKLGHGTASDIAARTDVPRSQVYGAADTLEDRGLIEVQHSTPRRFRPVPPEEAEKRLTAPLVADRDRAIEYLETIEETATDQEQRAAEVWTVHGTDAITDRLTDLATDATDRIFIGIDSPHRIDDALTSTLATQINDGVTVTVVSADPTVFDALPDGITAITVPPALDPGDLTTRVLVADGNAVLIAVQEAPTDAAETAIWSDGTGFATVLSQVVEAWFQTIAT